LGDAICAAALREINVAGDKLMFALGQKATRL
jgi:hypothetical protein